MNRQEKVEVRKKRKEQEREKENLVSQNLRHHHTMLQRWPTKSRYTYSIIRDSAAFAVVHAPMHNYA